MIYFITDDTYTKIGKSTNPLKRIKALQTSSPNTLKFMYLFDVKDSEEKKLHKYLNKYKTESNNEWFDLTNCDLIGILKEQKNPALTDIEKAEFLARRYNIDHFRGVDFNSQKRESQINRHQHLSRQKGLKKKHQEDIKSLLRDIRFHIENYPNKRIYYDPYVIKYGFSKNEISAFVRKAKLSKEVFNHNSKL